MCLQSTAFQCLYRSVHVERILATDFEDVIALACKDNPDLVPEYKSWHRCNDYKATFLELESGQTILHVISLFQIFMIVFQVEESKNELKSFFNELLLKQEQTHDLQER